MIDGINGILNNYKGNININESIKYIISLFQPVDTVNLEADIKQEIINILNSIPTSPSETHTPSRRWFLRSILVGGVTATMPQGFSAFSYDIDRSRGNDGSRGNGNGQENVVETEAENHEKGVHHGPSEMDIYTAGIVATAFGYTIAGQLIPKSDSNDAHGISTGDPTQKIFNIQTPISYPTVVRMFAALSVRLGLLQADITYRETEIEILKNSSNRNSKTIKKHEEQIGGSKHALDHELKELAINIPTILLLGNIANFASYVDLSKQEALKGINLPDKNELEDAGNDKTSLTASINRVLPELTPDLATEDNNVTSIKNRYFEGVEGVEGVEEQIAFIENKLTEKLNFMHTSCSVFGPLGTTYLTATLASNDSKSITELVFLLNYLRAEKEEHLDDTHINEVIEKTNDFMKELRKVIVAYGGNGAGAGFFGDPPLIFTLLTKGVDAWLIASGVGLITSFISAKVSFEILSKSLGLSMDIEETISAKLEGFKDVFKIIQNTFLQNFVNVTNSSQIEDTGLKERIETIKGQIRENRTLTLDLESYLQNLLGANAEAMNIPNIARNNNFSSTVEMLTGLKTEELEELINDTGDAEVNGNLDVVSQFIKDKNINNPLQKILIRAIASNGTLPHSAAEVVYTLFTQLPAVGSVSTLFKQLLGTESVTLDTFMPTAIKISLAVLIMSSFADNVAAMGTGNIVFEDVLDTIVNAMLNENPNIDRVTQKINELKQNILPYINAITCMLGVAGGSLSDIGNGANLLVAVKIIELVTQNEDGINLTDITIKLRDHVSNLGLSFVNTHAYILSISTLAVSIFYIYNITNSMKNFIQVNELSSVAAAA